jgi:hypothetical protein
MTANCDIHDYDPTMGPPEADDCELCWQARKKAVGCIRADQERDDFRRQIGLKPIANNTVINIPFGGGGHVM